MNIRLIKQQTTWVVLVIFALAIAVRILFIGSIPGGLNQDEASIGYDAWSLLEYGIDRWGLSWPIHFISWGSGQNALYAYLSLPFIALGGLTTFSIRLTASVLGCISLFVFWKLGKAKSDREGLLALLIIATSPWHIMASRWALESNAAPAFVLFGVYFLCRFDKQPNTHLPLGAALVTLATYAYGTVYFFAPIFLFCVFIYLALTKQINFTQLAISALTSFVIALPLILFIYNNSHGNSHIEFGPITIPKYPGDARYSGLFLPFVNGGMEQIPQNALTVLQMLLGGNWDGLPWNASPLWGPQYVLLTPFLIIGVTLALKTKQRTNVVMVTWLFVALITAFATSANINRINLIWLPSLWLSAQGIAALAVKSLPEKVMQGCIATIGVLFCMHYFIFWQKEISASFYPGLGEAIQKTIKDTPNAQVIAVTGHSNYMSTLFFSQTPTQKYLDTAVITNRYAPFINVESFDRFTFGFNSSSLSKFGSLVVHESELPMFSPSQYKITPFQRYASVIKRPENTKCHIDLDPTKLQGTQDHGHLGINTDVYGEGVGAWLYNNQHYAQALSVHGDSTWEAPIPENAHKLYLGVGMGKRANCSDGVTFSVYFDNKLAFTQTIKNEDYKFTRLQLHGEKNIKLETKAGATNSCDHGVWITPTYDICP